MPKQRGSPCRKRLPSVQKAGDPVAFANDHYAPNIQAIPVVKAQSQATIPTTSDVT